MPEKQERPVMPPLREPVLSFDAPSHIERTWVEKVDITATTYQKLPRGSLYKDVVGADASSPFARDILANHPTAYLLREIASPKTFPFAYRYFGLGETFTTQTLGQPNLTPEKYRRLVRTVETDQPVAADYQFPLGLTGDQTQIQLQQETIEEARLKIISEVIAIGADPLTGGESSEYGPLAIYESVVNEGTPIDTGFLVVKSTVSPFGNGKAAKITVKSKQGDFVISTKVTNGGSGYASAPTVSFSGGGGTGAAATTFLVSGKVDHVTITSFGSGYTSAPTVGFTGGAGTGAAATAYLGIVILNEQDYDQSLDVVLPTSRYLVPSGSVLGDARKEVKALDPYRDQVTTIGINTTVIDNFVYAYTGKVNIDMPDKLVSVTALIQKATSAGSSSETGSSSLSGNGSVSQSLRASSQASASIVPEAYPGIKQFWGSKIDCTHYHFFLVGPITDPNAVITKLNSLLSPSTVSAWPKFNPVVENITMYGGRASVQATATSQGSDSVGSSGSSSASAGGTGYSEEVGLTRKTIRISPTIHPLINLSGTTSDSQTVSAHADSEASGLGPLSTITRGPFTVSSAISPTSLAATAGANDWPSTGLFVYDIIPRIYRYGYIEFHAIVVNAANFPSS